MDRSALFVTWEQMYKERNYSQIPPQTLFNLKNRPSIHEEVLKTRSWAIEAHGDQRYGARPYVTHLDDVVRIGTTVWPCAPTEFILALLLHDVIEDTPLEEEDLRTRTNPLTAKIVDNVSNDPLQPPSVIADNLNSIIREINLFEDLGFGTVFVKTCDRISNVRHLLKSKGSHSLKIKYHSQYIELREALRSHKKFLTSGNVRSEILVVLFDLLDEVHRGLFARLVSDSGKATFPKEFVLTKPTWLSMQTESD
ncbi:HD domain-containing protein [Vibrio sp. D431a]|nr:HD domain-containing protein [Vibrio sp. D431a]